MHLLEKGGYCVIINNVKVIINNVTLTINNIKLTINNKN